MLQNSRLPDQGIAFQQRQNINNADIITNKPYNTQRWLEALELTASGSDSASMLVTPATHEPVEIYERLYLGTLQHATDMMILKKFNITHIVDCSISTLFKSLLDNTSIDKIIYKHIEPFDDRELLPFHESIQTIQLNLKDESCKNLLVCCTTGVNRSAAICVAYLMAILRKPLLEATKTVQRRVGQILGIQGVQIQLIQFAEEVNCLNVPAIWPVSHDNEDINNFFSSIKPNYFIQRTDSVVTTDTATK